MAAGRIGRPSVPVVHAAGRELRLEHVLIPHRQMAERIARDYRPNRARCVPVNVQLGPVPARHRNLLHVNKKRRGQMVVIKRAQKPAPDVLQTFVMLSMIMLCHLAEQLSFPVFVRTRRQ